MAPSGKHIVGGAVLMLQALACTGASEASAQPAPAQSASTTSPPQEGLRLFIIEKPADLLREELARDAPPRMPFKTPPAKDRLLTTVGLGYVQRADWGAELLAGGSFNGVQVQFNTLVTKGRDGVLVDRGFLSFYDPDRRWRVEAGDVFSMLRGASRGGRVSWAAAGGRRPAVSIYGPHPGNPDQTTVASYRDQIQIGNQTLLDAEVATDRSHHLRSRVVTPRLNAEISYRSTRAALRTRDAGVQAGVRLWRGLAVNAGAVLSIQAGDRSDWRTVSVRVPVTRLFDLTIERAFAGSRRSSSSTSALMGALNAGSLRLFHRHQFGTYDYLGQELVSTIERQQTQSMASYQPGPRLNLALQLATQRSDTGYLQHWEELQATFKLSPSTTLSAVTAVPDFNNLQRFRAHLRQELPGRFAIQAEYGRLSAFQAVHRELDRARFKVMLYKTVPLATPAGGAEVRGRVIDNEGRPVSGARVKLGVYTTDSEPDGTYRFRHVPSGSYDLAIDPEYLAAGYAWDGRVRRLTLSRPASVTADLLVAPLNAIHGRVFCDRNANGRFDPGEGVPGAIVRLADRVTATDPDGSYSFYNLMAGRYTLMLDRERLPADYDASSVGDLRVELGDSHPVTGADFRVALKIKPIIWRKDGK